MNKYFFKTVAIFIVSIILTSTVFANNYDLNNQDNAIEILTEKKIIIGNEYGDIMNTSPISREQMVCVIGRIFNIGDVKASIPADDLSDISDWAVSYVAYGYQEGYIDGYPDNCFKPKKIMNYEEAIKFAICAYQIIFSNKDKVKSFKENLDFPDEYINYAATNGLLTGVYGESGTPITRENAFALLYNVFKTEIVSGTKTDNTSDQNISANNKADENNIKKDSSVEKDSKEDVSKEENHENMVSIKIARDTVIREMQLESADQSNGGDTPILSNGKEIDFKEKKAYEFELLYDGLSIGKYIYIVETGIIEYLAK